MTLDEIKEHPVITIIGIMAASITVYKFITRK